MLEQHDFAMITNIICQAIKPLQETLGVMQQDIVNLKDGQERMEKDIVNLKDGQERMGKDIMDLKAGQARLEDDIRELHVIIETDLIKRINIIAEGHLDLARKFDKALAEARHDEMLQLRVQVLESDVRKINKRLDEMAS